MIKKSVVDVTFRFTIFKETLEASDLAVVDDMDYEFVSNTSGSAIEEADIVSVSFVGANQLSVS